MSSTTVFVTNLKHLWEENNGITSTVFGAIRHSKPVSPVFFKPYHTISDPFLRTFSIIKAPICALIVALGFAACAAYSALKLLINLNLNKNALAFTVHCLIATIAMLAAVIVSPIINALGLIAGGLATVLPSSEKQEALCAV